MRSFNETDKNKKKDRIKIPANPDSPTKEKLERLESRVKDSLKEGVSTLPGRPRKCPRKKMSPEWLWER